MDLKLNLENLKDLENSSIKVDTFKYYKMLLLFNSIEEGWTVKKSNESYVFKKNHENKREILEDSYLLNFMKLNLELNNKK
jgi:hypothetical protein